MSEEEPRIRLTDRKRAAILEGAVREFRARGFDNTSMDSIAKAHLEAGKAWESGATEAEMAEILQDIRHAQWRWDYSIASHGSFFHAPDETLRLLGNANNLAQEASHEERVSVLKKRLSQWAKTYRRFERSAMDPETQKNLEELGYGGSK